MTDDLINSVRNLANQNKELQEKYDYYFNECAKANLKVAKLRAKLDAANVKLASLDARTPRAAMNHFIINGRLLKLGLTYSQIESIFKVGTTILSGGFIVQTLTGDYWQTDLDIYTTDAKAVIMELNKTNEWVVPPKIVDRETAGSYEGTYPLTTIKVVYRGELLKGVYVEIIETADPFQTVKEFDFDFCKCYFDGTNFVALHQNAITSKSCQISQSKYDEKRAKKYRLRGFTVNVLVPNDPKTPFENEL